MPGGGEQMFLGIVLEMDATGAIRGASLADQAFRKTQKSAKQTADKVKEQQQIISKGLQVGAAAAAVGFGAYALGEKIQRDVLAPMVQEAGSFQVEMSQLQFVTRGTAQEMEELEDVAMRTGLATQWSPQEATLGLRMLRAAGLDTATALNELQTSLDLATGSAGALGLEEASTTTAAALLKFQKTGATGTQIMDAFAQATRETNFQFHDLPIYLNSLRDAPLILNMTAAEAFAVGGVMRNMGLSAADAGNAVAGFGKRMATVQRSMERYQRMVARGSKRMKPMVVQAWDKIGVSLFNAEGKMRRISDVLVDFADKLPLLTEKERFSTAATLFASQAQNVVNSLMRLKREGKEGTAAFRNLIQKLEQSQGSLRESAAAFENTLAGMQKFIEGTIQTIQISMGKMLLPVVEKINAVIREVLNAFLEWISRSPQAKKVLLGFAIGLVVITKVVGVLLMGFAALLVFTALMLPVMTAGAGGVGIMTIAMTALNVVLVPLIGFLGALIVVAAKVAVVFGLFYFMVKRNIGGIGDVLKMFWDDLKLIWSGIADVFFDNRIDTALKKQLEQRGLLGFIENFIKFKNQMKNLWGGIVDIFKVVGGILHILLWPFAQLLKFMMFVMAGIIKIIGGGKLRQGILLFRTLGWVIGILLVKALWALMFPLALATIKFVLIAGAILIVIGLIALVAYGIWQLGMYIGSLDFFRDWWNGIKIIFEDLKSAFSDIGTWFGELWQSFIDGAAEIGTHIMDSILHGLKEGWNTVKTWWTDSLQWFRDLLPGSDAKMGPLSDITASGQSFVTTFQAGADSAFPEFQSDMKQSLGETRESFTPAVPLAQPYFVDAGAGVQPGGAGAVQAGPVSLTIENMTFQVQQATPEEAKRLADMVIERIRDSIDNNNEASFL